MSLIKDYTLSLRGQVDAVVALDARGFLFGPVMANDLKVPFVPVSPKILQAKFGFSLTSLIFRSGRKGSCLENAP